MVDIGVCPLGETVINLNANDLSSDQKRWLGAAIEEEVETKVDLMRRFGLSRVLLNKYAKRYKDGREHRSRKGRPSVLDQISDEILIRFLEEDFDGRICVLRDKIRSEYIETLIRRGKWIEDEDDEGRDVPEISGRSLYKYILQCKLYCDSIDKSYND